MTAHRTIRLAHRASGDGSLLFLHANGFCKETWAAVVDEAGSPGHVLVDQWGHGESDAPPRPFDWWDEARDLLALIETFDAPVEVGVGHSSGGAVLAMAEILQPGTFARLVLIEPIIPPPPFRRTPHHPLVTGALRRRKAFVSRDEVLETYRGRGPFEFWDERALQAYVRCGFRDEGDGSVALRCDPDVEAEFFRSHSAHGAWERLPEIGCPVIVAAGALSRPEPGLDAALVVPRLRDGSLELVARATHFVPMEQPAALAALLTR